MTERTERIDPSILNSGHCMDCRKCCKYEPDELEDAPMFTEEQFQRVEREFGVGAIQFERRGDLYRVVLSDIPGSEKKICPFYDDPTGNCAVFAYEIFDCYTWPFYIMRKDDEVVITLSPDCPIVSRIPVQALAKYARAKIGPQMLQMAQQHPDLITHYHGNAIVLCNVNEF